MELPEDILRLVIAHSPVDFLTVSRGCGKFASDAISRMWTIVVGTMFTSVSIPGVKFAWDPVVDWYAAKYPGYHLTYSYSTKKLEWEITKIERVSLRPIKRHKTITFCRIDNLDALVRNGVPVRHVRILQKIMEMRIVQSSF